MSRPRVLVIGGGFGGLSVVHGLRKADVDITLLDKRNHHLFQPLLYQVASAVLSPNDIASPLRAILAGQKNLTVLLGEAVAIDLTAKVVTARDPDGKSHALPYDRLVLAAGLATSWFGREEAWAPHAPGLKDLDDALALRHRVLSAFERAEWSAEAADRRRLLTFVVVGGGPTGVEMAGALAEIARRSLVSDFRRVAPAEARVVLVEGGAGVLGTYAPSLRQAALDSLLSLGVEVRLGQRVADIDENGVLVRLADGSEARIEAATVVWAAGLRAAPIAATLGTPSDRMGRLVVNPDLSLPGHPEVFVIGDLAAAKEPTDQWPGVAQNALQGGAFVARQIKAPPSQPAVYRYRDLGSMATIGRSKAIAEVGGVALSGRLAWLMWLFIHLMALVGFRNRVAVLGEWAWSYLTWQRHARIIRPEPRR